MSIRPCLTQKTAVRLLKFFVISRIDYANCHLYDVSDCLIKRLKRMQNADGPPTHMGSNIVLNNTSIHRSYFISVVVVVVVVVVVISIAIVVIIIYCCCWRTFVVVVTLVVIVI